ncbi:MAG: maltotransferase domain-containing protein [Gaiellaceae bacterium]
MPSRAPAQLPPRIRIERVSPQLDCGRYPVKLLLGEEQEICADVIRDGHEVLGAELRYRRRGERRWRSAPMRQHLSGRWQASFAPDAVGSWELVVDAWVDRVASWQDELRRRVEGGQADLASELAEGGALLGVDELDLQLALAAPAGEHGELASSPALPVDVDRERAGFGAWYELFPRSWGGFEGVEKLLPRFAELGFDVLYFPPIHPIGRTHRKGRNNSLVAGPEDPGSPWAIGSEEGGHTEIDPELGTLEQFERLLERAREHGIEIALDFAIQCSPDHPWLREHPEWFRWRPDGTVKYAENPPKRYQDIVNVNFSSPQWRALWRELLRVVETWVERGVRIFRVDNPHTKPLAFWEWLIASVRRSHPDVVFLAEAFTRPVLMQTLAKLGFSQSYTYFTWRNTKAELIEYLEELTGSEMRHYFRPNFFANTPDILHEYLQRGGRPAFEARLVLAATLSPSYGIYSGYEHCENVPFEPGSEEYLGSEKYERMERRLDGPLLPLVQRLNRARRAQPAFRRLNNLSFLVTENDALIAYVKSSPEGTLLVVVNLDPFSEQEGVTVVPVALGLAPSFGVEDLLSGDRFLWRTGRNYVRLGPGKSHLLLVGA